jgi:hypothetical protein
MKKQLVRVMLAVLLVIFVASYAFAGGVVKLGYDTSGDHEVSAFGITGSEDVEDSFSASFEFVGAINDNFGVGGGFTLQIPRSQEQYPGDFYFYPFYGLIKIRSASKEFAPYFIGQIGYNLIYDGDINYKGTGTLDGDWYYGAGGGVIFKNRFQIEVLYSVNCGTYTFSGYEFDIEYSKVTLSIGICF